MIPQQKIYTDLDFLSLSTGEKAELIDGAIVAMLTSSAHSKLQASLAGILSHWERRKKKNASSDETSGGEGDDTGLWFLTEAATWYDMHNVFVHDVAAFTRKSLPTLAKAPIRATPFWVCEILSPSNWIQDTQYKRVILEKARVPYYWILDPEKSSLQVFSLSGTAPHYQTLHYVSSEVGTIRIEPFLDLEIDLKELFWMG